LLLQQRFQLMTVNRRRDDEWDLTTTVGATATLVAAARAAASRRPDRGDVEFELQARESDVAGAGWAALFAAKGIDEKESAGSVPMRYVTASLG
jgi:hypothetical protein